MRPFDFDRPHTMMPTVPAVLASQRDALETLCRKYGVASLFLFGSAARGMATPTSDMDFGVRFGSLPPGLNPFRRYMGLLDELQGLAGVPVDLVEWDAVRNPYLRASVESDRMRLYG